MWCRHETFFPLKYVTLTVALDVAKNTDDLCPCPRIYPPYFGTLELASQWPEVSNQKSRTKRPETASVCVLQNKVDGLHFVTISWNAVILGCYIRACFLICISFPLSSFHVLCERRVSVHIVHWIILNYRFTCLCMFRRHCTDLFEYTLGCVCRLVSVCVCVVWSGSLVSFGGSAETVRSP